MLFWGYFSKAAETNKKHNQRYIDKKIAKQDP